MENYDDIINMPHHVSEKHPRLSMEQRAAQFAPFAALTGYSDAVKETARVTEDRIELDDEEKDIIDNKLREIQNKLQSNPKATITYFVSDLKKSGGEYVTIIGTIKKIDEYKQCLILNDKKIISMNEIIEILM